MIRKRKLWSVSSILVAVALLLMGGFPATAQTQVRRMSILASHYPVNLGSVPYIVGIEKGFFREQGLEFDRILGDEGGGTGVRTILTADLPFGFVSTAAVLQAYLAGAPVKIFAGAKSTTPDVYYVTRKDAPFEKPEDLIGKRWGYTNPGSVTHMTLLLVLDALGIDPQSVRLVSTGGMGGGLTLLDAGGVDAAPLFEPPYASLKDKYKTLFSLYEILPRYQQGVFITSPQLAREQPEILVAFLEGYEKANQWIRENPREAAEMYARAAELEFENALFAVETAIRTDIWELVLDTDGINTALKGMRLAGVLRQGQEIDWDELLIQDFLPEERRADISRLDRNR